jgi:hypothetical protein
VVLRERRRDQRAPVAEGLEGELLTDQLFLDKEPRGPADLLLQDLSAVG